MTNPIKPPGSIGTPVVTELPKATETSKTEFRSELVTTPDIPSVRETAPSTSVTGTSSVNGAIADDLRAGRITPSQAVDRLVAQSMDSPMARRLAPEARARLETMVREQLVNDPALAALVGDLERGR